jgi:hypothetical protein
MGHSETGIAHATSGEKKRERGRERERERKLE